MMDNLLVVVQPNAGCSWLFLLFLAVAVAAADQGWTETHEVDDYQLAQPPWGISSYGNVDGNRSNYLSAGGFIMDIVRPGWSWHSGRQQQLIAPFCYDTIPNLMSACYTGQVKNECRAKLDGTPTYGGRFCLTNRPHTIIGPVCWNGQCYGAATRQVCESSSIQNGWFVGGKSNNFFHAHNGDGQ
jgi:hypothetical protein